MIRESKAPLFIQNQVSITLHRAWHERAKPCESHQQTWRNGELGVQWRLRLVLIGVGGDEVEPQSTSFNAHRLVTSPSLQTMETAHVNNAHVNVFKQFALPNSLWHVYLTFKVDRIQYGTLCHHLGALIRITYKLGDVE
jgi:hypothetical protein